MPFVHLIPNETGTHTDNANGVSVILDQKARPTTEAWAMVDDPPGEFDDESVTPTVHSYVEHTGSISDTRIIGRRWSFKFPKLSDAGAVAIQTIDKVTLFHVARRAGAGGATNHKVFCYNNLNTIINDFGTTISTPTSYAVVTNVLTTNPITGIAWAAEDFEERRIEFGTRRDATGASIHLTQLYLLVEYTEQPWATQGRGGGQWDRGTAGTGAWSTPGAGYGNWEVE